VSRAYLLDFAPGSAPTIKHTMVGQKYFKGGKRAFGKQI